MMRYERLMFPLLPDAAWNAFSSGDYDNAVVEAFKFAEITVRKKISATDKDYGVRLMEIAFDPIKGKLTDPTATTSSKNARCNLFKGAYGELRNPKAQSGPIITDPVVAAEEMMIAGKLLRILASPTTIDPRELATAPLRVIVDDPDNIRHWRRISQETFVSRLNDCACAWVLPWQPALSPAKIQLQFRATDKYEEHAQAKIRERFDCWSSGDPKYDAELRAEPCGLAVRLDRVQFSAPNDYALHLGPIKYWHYLAVHQTLWTPDSQTRALRDQLFNSAITDIPARRRCTLPSHFCLHMGVISKDGYALFRKRRIDAHMFPGAWEFGLGEFMHGPATMDKRFQAFENGEPDMFAFCRSAVGEELNSDNVTPEMFKIFGFAIEYVTLAPKLLVLHYSPLGHEALMDGMLKAADASQAVDSALLEPSALAQMVFKRKEGWGPTSKLCLWLALMDKVESARAKKALSDELDRLIPK
jgi:hypothetical protein